MTWLAPSAAGDPAALRAVAQQLLREADVISERIGLIAARVNLMVYAGPAADRFRGRIGDANQQTAQADARLRQLAGWCEQRARLIESGVL